MAASDILIHRDFAVINGYVQLPPNAERDKSRVRLEDAVSLYGDLCEVVELSMGSGPCHGRKSGAQRVFRLPGTVPGQSLGQFDPLKLLG